MHAVATGDAPKNGLVAVKVQYPGALPVMVSDLKNIRAAAFYLSKTEIKFDLVSAVDELNKQIRLEFDFTREARVMDTISEHLRPQSKRLQIPRSVGGLVTKSSLVMSFIEGVPLLEARTRVSQMSPRARDAAKRLILSRISEAYGRMIFGEGLFQADGHPGNILIGRGGRVGLLDYGQSKQLPDEKRRAFAELVLALNRGRASEISAALGDLGVVTERKDPEIRTEMAYGMFDTRGKVNPFDPNSPLKQSAISTFPADMFFVMRVVQLLRGLADGMACRVLQGGSCLFRGVARSPNLIHFLSETPPKSKLCRPLNVSDIRSPAINKNDFPAGRRNGTASYLSYLYKLS
ncbi:hypothetical protein Vafri_8592 [Volvox africanus]|uniref:ABC1 atypical kinase-like domain-containing protein n=1 Tax=Volvox africanus TaxID=51714 RepID=A0A8J4B394_9CHLO|nr:hypothetical protein Vafri_8592 [Volvox africanus]